MRIDETGVGAYRVSTLYIPGPEMTALVRKWGNSAAVRIPARLLADAGLDLDQPIEIREDRGRIIIERVREKEISLDDLLKRIRPENLHDPLDTGTPVGREIW